MNSSTDTQDISRPEAQELMKELRRAKQKIELREDEISDLEAEVERLRSGIKHIRDRLEYINLRMQPADWGAHDVETAFRACIADCEHALDRAGGQS